MGREYAEINPAMLRWARDRAGYTVEQVAKKLGVKPDFVAQLEAGTKRLTLGRLDALANIYKRPTVLFYAEKAPLEADVDVADFRAHKEMNPELIYQLRRARERAEVALSLLDELGQSLPKLTFRCNATEEAAAVGERLREALCVTYEMQRSWSGDSEGYRALNAWKDAAERLGVIVTGASKRELADARGVSVFGHGNDIPIVILASESPRGRSFTLLHELAHLGLRRGGICDLHESGVEAFCNKVAAAALMPAKHLLSEPEVRISTGVRAWPDPLLRVLARRYSVSEQAMLLRLVTLGRASQGFYNSKKAEYEQRARQALAEKKGGPIPQPILAIATNGRRFTRVVLEALQQGKITAHRAATLLDVSYRYVPEIERDMIRHSVKTEAAS